MHQIRHLKDVGLVEVGVTGSGRADAVCLVSSTDMRGMRIYLTEHCHSGDACNAHAFLSLSDMMKLAFKDQRQGWREGIGQASHVVHAKPWAT